jgi:diadenosine tetraphosphate (Ap4A) HIT family hydrolase
MSFIARFNPETNTLHRFEHWVVLLREKQVTLGASIIASTREVASIGDLDMNEIGELPLVIQWYEDLCVKLFNAERFNYIAAMMKDPFVHFHAFPRYSSERHQYNEIWTDKDWPRVVQFSDVAIVPETLEALRSSMREESN